MFQPPFGLSWSQCWSLYQLSQSREAVNFGKQIQDILAHKDLETKSERIAEGKVVETFTRSERSDNN